MNGRWTILEQKFRRRLYDMGIYKRGQEVMGRVVEYIDRVRSVG